MDCCSPPLLNYCARLLNFLIQELYPIENTKINAIMDKAIIIIQIAVIITVKLLGISVFFFQVAKSKNKLMSKIIIKIDKNK